MGTQVLIGSVGQYTNPQDKQTTDFTVVEDVCLQSPRIAVKFEHAAEAVRIDMKNVKFPYPSLFKTNDY